MVFEESQHRIRAMALVHEKLYHSDNLSNINFGEYLESVVGQLIRSYSREGIRLALSLESIEMDVEVAIPCGLVVNELVTNALKHAFPDDGTGTISVGLRRLSDRIIELTVADDGIGIPADADIRNATSMGLTLVQALTEQMSGDVRIERTAGTRFVVEFSA
jgi:two-component sensor histidine kinase